MEYLINTKFIQRNLEMKLKMKKKTKTKKLIKIKKKEGILKTFSKIKSMLLT